MLIQVDRAVNIVPLLGKPLNKKGVGRRGRRAKNLDCYEQWGTLTMEMLLFWLKG
jgi:hypothetical protein